MRDPDLVLRAQRAASALERAWERWRVMHGFGADPLPPVSSYVGYSLEEPWGQPRVVFGIGADEAEKLAAILDGHDCVGPVHAEIAGRPEWRQQAVQDWRQQPIGSDTGPALGWPPLPGTAVHVPAQQPQPDVERDGARLNGPVRAIDSSAEAGPAEEHDSSIRNGHLAGLVGQEPLTELPPFPEDEPFAEEEPFPGVVRFGDDGSPSAKPEFAGEFVGAPVPADGEDTSVTAAKPARGGQARTRTSAKSPGGSQRKAGQPGQAKSPVRRKTSLTSPLQMPKRVRPRRPSDAAAAVNAATVAEDASVTPTAVDESANATAVDERVAVAAEYESVAVVAEDQSVAAVAEDESVAEPAEDESVASAGNVEQGPVEENEAESAEPDGAA